LRRDKKHEKCKEGGSKRSGKVLCCVCLPVIIIMSLLMSFIAT